MIPAPDTRERPYCGRFAPSPTGPMHFGSLVAALASWLDARAHGGRWLLRFEDLDTPRNQPGAADAILRSLEACGLCWDGAISWQSHRSEGYHAALDKLRTLGRAYGCRCTRREIADSTLLPDGSRRYPGTCRAGLPPGVPARSWRLRVAPGKIRFDDRQQGIQSEDVAEAVGDFVLLRADGIVAYQLAVVVDDAEQGISDVVRGADLLDSTPRQIALQRALGLPTPRYLHVPVAVNAAGEKLSKQTLAPALQDGLAASALRAALAFLALPVADAPDEPAAPVLLAWAVEQWPNRSAVPGRCRSAPGQFDQASRRRDRA